MKIESSIPRTFAFFMLWCGLAFTDTAQGAAFKCVDAAGRTTYSDAPCEPSARGKEILGGRSVAPPSSAPGSREPVSELTETQQKDFATRFHAMCVKGNGRTNSDAGCRCLAESAAMRAKYADYKLMLAHRDAMTNTTLESFRKTVEAAGTSCRPGGDVAGGGAPRPGTDLARQFDAGGGAGKSDTSLYGTGTGFFVSPVGHVMTNAHVAGQCRQIKARHATGEVVELKTIAVDTKSDLALLKGVFASPLAAASFREPEPPLGETVVVFGFPLAQTLTTTGNLTTGTLSGLAGPQNDPSKYQISAPVQSGNSGGAVLDESGLVIGVVQSKLLSARGDTPQNVNFAVKGKVARDFLGANAVAPELRKQQAQRKVSEIAQDATRMSVMIGCFR